jgi:hypothetical protein
MPWTWGSRTEVKELSGTNEVPILVLDDGEVISGASMIAPLAARASRCPCSGEELSDG